MAKVLYWTKKTTVENKIEIIIFAFLMLKLFKHYLSVDNMVQLSLRFLALTVMLVFISYAAARIVQSAGENNKEALLILIALFLVSFSSNSVLLLDSWFKDFDALKNSFTVLSALLTFVVIDKPRIKWCIPFYCFACLVIEPYFSFTYFPMLVILFTYKTQFGENRSENKDLMASTLISSALAFLFFDLKIFSDNSEIKDMLKENLAQTALSYTLILPLSVIITAVLIHAYNISNDKVFKKIVLMLVLEPFVFVFSIFTVKTDLNFIMTAVFVQICSIFYFVYVKNKAFILSLERVELFFKKNLFALLITVIYLASFSNFAKIIYAGLTQAKDFHGLWA